MIQKRLIMPPIPNVELNFEKLEEFCINELRSKNWQPGNDSQYRNSLLQGEHLSFGLAIFPTSMKSDVVQNWFNNYSDCRVNASLNRDISQSQPKLTKQSPQLVKSSRKLEVSRKIYVNENKHKDNMTKNHMDCILFLFRLPLEQSSPQEKSASFLHIYFFNDKEIGHKLPPQNISRLQFLQKKLDAPTSSFASTLYKATLRHYDHTDLPIIEITQQMNDYNLAPTIPISGSSIPNTNLTPRKFINKDNGMTLDRNNTIIDFVETSLAPYELHNDIGGNPSSSQSSDQFDLASIDHPVEIMNPFSADYSWHDDIAYLELKNNTSYQDITIEKVYTRSFSMLEPPTFPQQICVGESIGMAFIKTQNDFQSVTHELSHWPPSYSQIKEYLDSPNKPLGLNSISLTDILNSQHLLQTVSLGIKWHYSNSNNMNWSQIDFSSPIVQRLLEVEATDEGPSFSNDEKTMIEISLKNKSGHNLHLFMYPIFAHPSTPIKKENRGSTDSTYAKNLIEVGTIGPGISVIKRIKYSDFHNPYNILPTILLYESQTKNYFFFSPTNYTR